jgi:hypothetical protein
MITLPPRQSSVQKRGTTTAPRAELDPASCPPTLTITTAAKDFKNRLKNFQYNIFGALYPQTLKTFTLLTSEKILFPH